jgi:large subunit ribosomal protein L4
MEAPLYNQSAQSIGTIELPDALFHVALNADLLHQVVVSQESNQRQHLAHAKGRGEVRGGGIKPWRQKGTGRARHGSIRSPIWKGGGVTHGPTKEENYKKKINKKMARKALAMSLSSKVTDGQMVVLDALTLSRMKTKEMMSVVKAVSGLFPTFRHGRSSSSTLLIAVPKNADGVVVRAARNIPNVEVTEARNLNAREVLSRQYVVMLKDAIGEITAIK